MICPYDLRECVFHLSQQRVIYEVRLVWSKIWRIWHGLTFERRPSVFTKNFKLQTWLHNFFIKTVDLMEKRVSGTCSESPGLRVYALAFILNTLLFSFDLLRSYTCNQTRDNKCLFSCPATLHECWNCLVMLSFSLFRTLLDIFSSFYIMSLFSIDLNFNGINSFSNYVCMAHCSRTITM